MQVLHNEHFRSLVKGNVLEEFEPSDEPLLEQNILLFLLPDFSYHFVIVALDDDLVVVCVLEHQKAVVDQGLGRPLVMLGGNYGGNVLDEFQRNLNFLGKLQEEFQNQGLLQSLGNHIAKDCRRGQRGNSFAKNLLNEILLRRISFGFVMEMNN